MFINVGAKDKGTLSDIPTKTALKKAIADNPDNVVLYDTSDFNGKTSRTAANLDEGVNYAVTGPNPYTSRKWYATVAKGLNGKITVK